MIFGYRFLFPVHSEWDVVHLSKYMQNSSKCEFQISKCLDIFWECRLAKRAWIDYQIEVQPLIRLLYVPMIHMHRKIRIKNVQVVQHPLKLSITQGSWSKKNSSFPFILSFELFCPFQKAAITFQHMALPISQVGRTILFSYIEWRSM